MIGDMEMRQYMAAVPIILVVTVCLSLIAFGQQHHNPQHVISAQKEALAALDFLNGVWKGPAWILTPSGHKHNMTQTERVGPFLGGAIKIIEGRGHDSDGTVSFNAMGIISYDVQKRSYSMRSYAMGRVGDFELKKTKDGFGWTISAGPMTMQYTAVVKDGTWHEVGERIMPGQKPVRFFEMTLGRVSDTNWPAAGAIKP
jgi:hypothetical protein